ncbi:MAG: penicillin-binding transpeptidase domain-containing protein [Ruminococcus sp.]|nr:penicillin-binding transpeptidase domain-containing protein [Ruminococcus sp.]
MTKKFYKIVLMLFLVFSIFLIRIVDLAYSHHDYYLEEYKKINEVYILGSSAPRGRILDINGKVIVDNIGVNKIVYHKPNNITAKEEIEIAKSLVELTNYAYNYNKDLLKEYYLITRDDNNLITEEEKRLYNERKITKDELHNLKLERITDVMLDELNDLEKYSSYFYYLMNDGYIYDNKVLLKDIDDNLYASIIESDLRGVFGEMDWSRNYVYGDTLKSILGTISNSLPEEKSYLLNDGYSYLDKVGISGLEEYYEEYLKGEKAVYKLENNDLVMVSEAKRGKDLVLEIDIDIQLKVEEIIKTSIIKAKKEPNTEYYKESYALISEPSTGAVKAIAGIRLIKDNTFQDVSINVIKNAYTMGSVVKAASMTVGYLNKAIDINTTMTDSCVKLSNIPAKCSWKKLGRINDIKALSLSSNYYQFITALKVAGYDYTYDMEAPVTLEDFNKYRDVFKSFGLGAKTEIDLPKESIGLVGDKIAPDLLMNLAIGQYDLYTPVSLLQYANTIANNGTRLKLNLMHSIKDKEDIIIENEVKELNKVNLEEKYLNRIKDGLREVMKTGTGYYYAKENVKGAGKTGTSETYIDSDYDGTLDAYVISNTFWMYAPFDNPKYSMVVISPNISNLNGKSSYISGVNRVIARNINDFLFSS